MNPIAVCSSCSKLALFLLLGAASACGSETGAHSGTGAVGPQSAAGSTTAAGGGAAVTGGAWSRGATGGGDDAGNSDPATATGGAALEDPAGGKAVAGGSPSLQAAAGGSLGGSAAMGGGGGSNAGGTSGVPSSSGAGPATGGGFGEANATGGANPATGGVSEQGSPGGASGDVSSAGGATPSAGAAGGAGAPDQTDSFVLAWQDDFDTLDASLWELQTFSWDGNLAQFSTANATVANGVVSIGLTEEPSDSEKPYRGVEMRSTKTMTYGKVEARIRFAKGSGVISGLVAIYTPWPADDWNEIDFEHLGNSSRSIQTNCQVYTGPVTEAVTTSVKPTTFEQIVDLGFDAEEDFHVYSAEWTPVDVKFIVDGQVVRTWSDEIARMKLPQNILFTIWASDSPSWAGAVDASTAPTSAEMDWIKVYEYRR